MNSAIEITNLIYKYAEFIDHGDLMGAADLFKNARMKLVGSDQLQDHVATGVMLKKFVKIYGDGTPKTKHVTTNPILEIDEEAGTAACRSYYTVLQSTDEIPLQVIASGRYHDEFERVDGTWRFSYRDLTLFDMQGNINGHLSL